MNGFHIIKRYENDSEMLELSRSSSYTGTLIDDLVTKDIQDPYRMLTSRSEYRLLLRQDNADERLMPFGKKIGLLSEDAYEEFCERQKMKEDIKCMLIEHFIIKIMLLNLKQQISIVCL